MKLIRILTEIDFLIQNRKTTDILDPLGFRVKLSFAILDFSEFSKSSNSRSSHYGSEAKSC
jgi:hypothetical protein